MSKKNKNAPAPEQENVTVKQSKKKKKKGNIYLHLGIILEKKILLSKNILTATSFPSIKTQLLKPPPTETENGAMWQPLHTIFCLTLPIFLTVQIKKSPAFTVRLGKAVIQAIMFIPATQRMLRRA